MGVVIGVCGGWWGIGEVVCFGVGEVVSVGVCSIGVDIRMISAMVTKLHLERTAAHRQRQNLVAQANSKNG